MQAKAVVKIVLEVGVNDTWGDDCTVAQVSRQAKESAKHKLNSLLKSKDGVLLRSMEIETVIVTDVP